ncbi:ribonuclease H-like domain-containing protein [Tanacetum coccineum]
MDLEQNNSLAKLSLLKQGEYDTWRLRIESYIQLQDYSLWEIIEEGNSFKPVAQTTREADGTSTTIIPGAVTIEEKILKKNDLKAQNILMMILPSEHLITFNKHKDAKSLFEVIEARFGGNEATKKTQKTLLKQMYETFSTSSSESLDSIFNRLQKIGMHVVVWRNKSDLGSISFDDLYNNFKIVELEVKRSVTSSSNSGSQNLAFVSGHSSTNDDNIANVHVSTGSSPVSTASTNNSTACLSDATIYAYLATQPNGSQVVHEDLDQVHKDDLDEMDLKWQLALLSMKARKFYQRTGKKIIINGSDTAGYDKKKVECFNCHKLGHFARECRNPKSQENRSRRQNSSRRTVNVEEASPKAMLTIDGTGFDWSYMEQEEASTNFTLTAFSDSEIQNNKTCSKTCLKNYEDLKTQYDKLRVELRKSESDLSNYKRGLASVEERLVFYKKNESMLNDQIAVLKRAASYKDSDINGLEKKVERLKKEKEENQFKIDNYENASKSLDQMIGNQLVDNNKKGLGYNVVPPPLKGLFAPPSVDLSIKKTSDALIIEDWVSDCDEDETVVLESLNVQKPKQADQPRKVCQNPRNNSTSWNTPKPKKLGVGFQFTPKDCFVCESFNHLIKDCDFHDKKMVQKPVLNNVIKVTGQREVRPVWTNAMRVNHQNFSNSKRNFAPKAVLTKSGLILVSAARPINTDVRCQTKDKCFYQQTVLKSRNLSNQVNTANVISVNTVGKQGINVVKPTSYWAWRPKVKMINHVYKNTGFCVCKQFDYVDPTGRNKVLNSPYFMVKSWLVQDQTVLGQTATGKESLNPFMGGSLPKTLSPMIHISQEVILLKEERTEYILLEMTEAKDFEVCKITRADGTSSFHGDFQALLRRLDRQDLFQLYSLVQERYKHRSIEGHDLDLWGDLKMMFDPNKEDDMWLNQHYWELLRWKLHEYNGVHSLFLDGTSIQIKMLVDKKYPLKKEILKKMINLKIEAEKESDMAYELIKFIKSQIAEQITPKVSYLYAVKRIFRYLKGQPKLGLWYPKDSPFDLEDFSDSDYAGASLDRKSTTGGCQFLGKWLISWKAKRTTEISQSSRPIHLVADETVYKEWADGMERAASTASSLEAELDSGNINRTQSMVTLNESFPLGTDSGSGPRCQDTILGLQKLKLGKDIQELHALKNRNLNYKVNTVKENSVNTAKGKRMTSAVGEQGIYAVKPTTYWA